MCTTFSIVNPSKIMFARNLDVDYEAGVIFVNPRRVAKSAYFLKGCNEISARWVSKYGSVTFNQISKDIPHGGMNEKGLVVEHLFLAESIYPPKDERPALISHQWVQYILDSCKTVEEALALQGQVRISDTEYKIPIHFHLIDKSGDRAIIEFIKGETKIYNGENYTVGVLANDNYATSLKNIEHQTKLVPDQPAPEFATESLERFLSVHQQVQNHDVSNEINALDFCFNTLDSVINSTQWQLVYDLSKMTIFYKTASNKKIRKIAMDPLNFESSDKLATISIHEEPEKAENWKPYSKQINKAMIYGMCEASEFFDQNFGNEKAEIANL